jgi:hypothetical protein
MEVDELESAGLAHVERARQRLAAISFTSTRKACFHRLRYPPNVEFDWYARFPFILLRVIKWVAETWRIQAACAWMRVAARLVQLTTPMFGPPWSCRRKKQ